jgi:DNA polymerase III delta subunit
MPLHVLIGPDDAARDTRAGELTGPGPHRYDLTVDGGAGLVDLLSTRSLFGQTRTILASPVAALSAATAAALPAVSDVDVVVLTGSHEPPAAVMRALAVVDVTRFPVPTAKDAPGRVRALLEATGVEADPAAVRLLTRRAPVDWARVHRAVTTVADLGLGQLSADLAVALVGDGGPSGAPWDVASAVEDGDLPRAVEAARAAGPVGTVAYLLRRTQQAGLVVDHAPGAPRSAARLAARLGPRGVAASFDLLVRADRDVKVGPDPHARLALVLARLVDLWGPRR